MANEVKSQGTQVFFVDNTGTAALVKLTCPTAISGTTGGKADQIETTCLDETDTRTYLRGLHTPSEISIPFNLYPKDAGHQLLFEMKDSGDPTEWMVCLSESATPPTLTGSDLTPPTDRTSFEFQGYVSDVVLDIATNEVVRGTLTVQRTGGITPHWVTA